MAALDSCQGLCSTRGTEISQQWTLTVPTVSTAMTLSRFILQDYRSYSVIYFLKWGNETNWASKSSGHNEDPFLSYNLNIKRDSNPPQKDGNCSLIDILRMHV